MSALPTRPLGNTGFDVTVLSLGGVTYNQLPDDEAAAVVRRAIDLGINYIDTAHGYTESERKIGLVLPEHRDQVFLATKSTARDGDGMRREVEQSLDRLQTDRIESVQIHDVRSDADVDRALAPGGAVEALEQLRADGVLRFIGITGHRSPEVLARAIDLYPFDTVLCSLGAVHHAVRSFHDVVMTAARRRGTAVLGMKVMAYQFLSDVAEDALRFVMGLEGVASAVVGVDNIAQLEANIEVARRCEPLSQDEHAALLAEARRIYDERRDKAWFVKLPGHEEE